MLNIITRYNNCIFHSITSITFPINCFALNSWTLFSNSFFHFFLRTRKFSLLIVVLYLPATSLAKLFFAKKHCLSVCLVFPQWMIQSSQNCYFFIYKTSTGRHTGFELHITVWLDHSIFTTAFACFLLFLIHKFYEYASSHIYCAFGQRKCVVPEPLLVLWLLSFVLISFHLL